MRIAGKAQAREAKEHHRQGCRPRRLKMTIGWLTQVFAAKSL